ncbi:MAG: class I SAM-dependent methyltransferase, partial [Gammaproteobacteria bacterium]
RTSDLNLSNSYSKFVGLIPPGCSILDGGCGAGRDALFFKNKGYRVTAFDACQKMVELTSDYANIPCFNMKLQDIDFENEFDAGWTNASLLHLKIEDLRNVFFKMANALKSGAYWYMSFKEGVGSGIENNRYFLYQTIDSLSEFIANLNFFSIHEIWIEEQQDIKRIKKWVNCIVRINKEKLNAYRI